MARWIRRVAVLTRLDDQDRVLVPAVVDGLTQDDLKIQQGALVACAYARWRELRTPLSDFTLSTASMDLAQRAQGLWNDVEASGWL
ncbi:MAG: hypothetical protein H6733_13020 [Alphaproteobacteria bacterium]|nr:hypothetical protein [Alphaproteobacteria bacterium]